MQRALPPLNALKAFEAAARLGTMTRAAEELGVTPTAVSQQVKTLEAHFARTLFHRHSSGLLLTDAGRAIYPAVAQGFDRLADAGALFEAGAGRARLTVSTLPSVAVKWLGPLLPRLLRREPGLRVALRVEEDPVAFGRENIDVRLCYGGHYYPDLAIEELATDQVAPLCRPDLLDGEVPLRRAEHLARHTLIHTDWGTAFASGPTWSQWLRAAGVEAGPWAHAGHRVGMSGLALDLAAAGQGVALGQSLLARGDIASGRLVSPFGPALAIQVPYCLAYPHSKSDRDSVRAFVDWIKAEAGAPA